MDCGSSDYLMDAGVRNVVLLRLQNTSQRWLGYRGGLFPPPHLTDRTGPALEEPIRQRPDKLLPLDDGVLWERIPQPSSHKDPLEQ